MFYVPTSYRYSSEYNVTFLINILQLVLGIKQRFKSFRVSNHLFIRDNFNAFLFVRIILRYKKFCTCFWAKKGFNCIFQWIHVCYVQCFMYNNSLPNFTSFFAWLSLIIHSLYIKVKNSLPKYYISIWSKIRDKRVVGHTIHIVDYWNLKA